MNATAIVQTRLCTLFCCALPLLAPVVSTAQTQFSYTVTDLGTLGGVASTANAVNASGDIVGYAQTADGSAHAFIFKDGKMQDLGTLGGAGSTAAATNLANIAGASDVPGTTAYHAFARADQGVADLGTLGGNQSSALGTNTPGQIVGFSSVADGSVHAFLHVEGRMYDLNTLCDMPGGGFRLLTVARAINDSLIIVGEGINKDGAKHAFVATPVAVDGGQWRYVSGEACCGGDSSQWVWIQIEGGWWWESNCGCYRWHGPPDNQPPCPPQRPRCWWAPLPCPPRHQPSPTPPPTPTPTPPRRNQSPTPPPQRTPNWQPTPPPLTHVPGTPQTTPPPQQTPPSPRLFVPGVPQPSATPSRQRKPSSTGRRGLNAPTSTPPPATIRGERVPEHNAPSRVPLSKPSRIQARPSPSPTPPLIR